MKIHASALKHGVAPEDAALAAENPVFLSDLDDHSPQRQFRLGFDGAGRLLELVVLRFDSGNEMVIHAMKARRQYVELLE
ncbi:MAG: toxin [Frankiales bacterium]|nr:toxin [Frankiales bacterium]